MANEDHLKLLQEGDVASWNQWRENHPDVRPDLSGANLRSADLYKANLRATNLSGTNLSNANLRSAVLFKADLGSADLFRANLRNANLSSAVLNSANLIRADLSSADLSFADLSGAHLVFANLSQADCSHAQLVSANLAKALLVGTVLQKADLTDAIIYGTSVWDTDLEGAIQENLVITPEDGPEVTVDDLEVAQFVFLLLNREKLRNVLNAVTERGVLILGRFGGGGIEVLRAIAETLREERYLPIIFDFERPSDRNYTETVKTLVGLSRFVIVDLSGPSVPQELYATVPHFKIPFVPILEDGRKEWTMAVDLFEYPWVLRPPVIFTGVDDLLDKVRTEIIAPAEERIEERQELLHKLFQR